MSELGKGQDICHIGRDILTLARFSAFFHTPSPFHPTLWGKMVEFSDAVFAPGVRMNGACFALNQMFVRRTVWLQLTFVTHLLTHLLTTR
jgi:hypothetical protein